MTPTTPQSGTAGRRLAEALSLAVYEVLGNSEKAQVVTPSDGNGPLRRGYHCHNSWELFFVVQGEFLFETVPGAAVTHLRGALLVVPPETLHMAVDWLPQPTGGTTMNLNLPGDKVPFGGLSVRRGTDVVETALSESELTAWQALLGTPPGEIAKAVSRNLRGGYWEREQAVSQVRLLLTSVGQVLCAREDAVADSRPDYVGRAIAALETRYFDPELTAGRVAKAAGVSVSHLARLFRAATGQSVHERLIATRMRHAVDLLTRTERPIKEIAHLTGWSNQLYFSTAFRRHHGASPSAIRKPDGA